MRAIVTLFLLTALFFHLYAQSPKIDSLVEQLRHAPLDTMRVALLNEISLEHWDREPEKTLAYAQQALVLARKLDYDRGEANSYHCLGVYYWQQNQPAAAISHYTHAQRLYQAIHDRRGVAKTLTNLGLVYIDMGQDIRALENFLKSLKVFRALGEKNAEAQTLNNIGLIYKNRQESAEAIAFFQQALSIWKRMGRQQALAGVLSNLSEVFVNQQAYDVALRYNQQALGIFERLKDINGQIICQNNGGNIYLKKRALSDASRHFQAALALNESYQSKSLLVASYNGLGAVCAQTGQPATAIQHYRKAYELAQCNGLKDAVRSASEGLATAYANSKNYENAFRFLQQATALRDSLYSRESTAQLARLRTSYETEKKQIEIDLLKKEKALARSSRNLMMLGMGSLLIMATLGFNQQRLRVKKNRELLVKNQQLYLAQQTLAEARLSSSQLREQQLQEELEFRSKSLTTHTLNLIQKNSIMEEIRETVAEVLKSSQKNETSPVYKRLINLVDYSFSLDKDWDDFKLHFEQVHRGFFTQLKEKHPDLSAGDLRLCALVRLNMNLKESAAVMSISPESVKTARYRLRKKLNLEEEQSLTDYLLTL